MKFIKTPFIGSEVIEENGVSHMHYAWFAEVEFNEEEKTLNDVAVSDTSDIRLTLIPHKHIEGKIWLMRANL